MMVDKVLMRSWGIELNLCFLILQLPWCRVCSCWSSFGRVYFWQQWVGCVWCHVIWSVMSTSFIVGVSTITENGRVSFFPGKKGESDESWYPWDQSMLALFYIVWRSRNIAQSDLCFGWDQCPEISSFFYPRDVRYQGTLWTPSRAWEGWRLRYDICNQDKAKLSAQRKLVSN